MSDHHQKRYKLFIESRPKRVFVSHSGLEKHHIIPKAIDPTISKSKDNIVVLTSREHYLAHWMLAKIYGGKMWFAFNMMRRVIPGDSKTSVLFSLAKSYISQCISDSNTGRPQSENSKKLLSERMTGKLWVRHKDDSEDILLMGNIDELYLNGTYVSILTGRKNSVESIQNLIDNNGIKGKTTYNNGISIKYFSENDPNIPDGYYKGYTDALREKFSISHTGSLFYYNPITLEQIRSKSDKDIPEGFIPGKIDGYQQGLANMNDPNKKNVFDLLLGKRQYISELEYENTLTTVMSPNNGYYVLLDNFFFDSILTFNLICYKFAPSLDIKSLDKVFKSHFNNRSGAKFIFDFTGKSFRELGVDIKSFKNYNVNDILNKTIIRSIDIEKFDGNDVRRAFYSKRTI